MALETSRPAGSIAAQTPSLPSAPVEALLPALGPRSSDPPRRLHHILPQALPARRRDRNSPEAAEALHRRDDPGSQPFQSSSWQDVLQNGIIFQRIARSRLPQLLVSFLPHGESVSTEHVGNTLEQVSQWSQDLAVYRDAGQ